MPPVDLRSALAGLTQSKSEVQEVGVNKVEPIPTVAAPPPEPPKPEFTFLVGELVHLEGRITNIMGDEIHVQLAENNRTYIFPRKLFVEAHS